MFSMIPMLQEVLARPDTDSEEDSDTESPAPEALARYLAIRRHTAFSPAGPCAAGAATAQSALNPNLLQKLQRLSPHRGPSTTSNTPSSTENDDDEELTDAERLARY